MIAGAARSLLLGEGHGACAAAPSSHCELGACGAGGGSFGCGVCVGRTCLALCSSCLGAVRAWPTFLRSIIVRCEIQRNKRAGAASWACLAAGAATPASLGQVVGASRAGCTFPSGGLVGLGRAELAEGPPAQLDSDGIGGALGSRRGGHVKCIPGHELEGGGALGEVGGICGGGVNCLADSECDGTGGSVGQELVACDNVSTSCTLGACGRDAVRSCSQQQSRC
jgi:hypothetical protein